MTDTVGGIDGRWPALAQAIERRRILVVGDVMLDHTVAGRAHRLSPEAPVPVLMAEEDRYGLGGAANVARNLSSLGARVLLAGVVGPDEDGSRLLALCQAASIDTEAVLDVRGRMTTVKTRFVTEKQQVLRVDSEVAEPLAPREERELIARMGTGRVDAVIISDYAKGVVTERVVDAALLRAAVYEAPSVVDPKGVRFERYAGCTIITPNATEAAVATGCRVDDDEDSEMAARSLLDTVGCRAVVITRGSRGVSLVTPTCARHLPAHTQEVFDVAGAGDTLVATLTLALACGSSLLEAVDLANTAAAVVVQARGVAAITADELGRALGGQQRPFADEAQEEEKAAA